MNKKTEQQNEDTLASLEIQALTSVVSKIDEIAALNSKLDRISRHLEGSRIEDVLQNYANPWRIMRVNFLVGLSRGVGMTVGTAFFLGVFIYILSQSVSMPVIGEYIAELLKWIDTYRAF